MFQLQLEVHVDMSNVSLILCHTLFNYYHCGYKYHVYVISCFMSIEVHQECLYFFISSNGTPFAQRASYLAQHSSKCIPNGTHTLTIVEPMFQKLSKPLFRTQYQ